MKRVGKVLIDRIGFRKRLIKIVYGEIVAITIIHIGAAIKIQRNCPGFFCKFMPQLKVGPVNIKAGICAGEMCNRTIYRVAIDISGVCGGRSVWSGCLKYDIGPEYH